MTPQQPFIPENYAHAPQLGQTKENVLYIFTPRKWGNQARRPLQYNFSENSFQENAQKAIHEANTAYGSARGSIERLLANDTSLNSALPSAGAQNIYNLDHLSDNYTFVLVTHQKRNQLQKASFTLPGSQMIVYYGYFVDEPLNMTLHGANPTPNPQAALVVTHQTTVSESFTYGQQGQKRRIDTKSDEDVIDPATMTALSTHDLYYMGPDVLYSSVGPMSAENTYMDTLGIDSKLNPANMGIVRSSSMMQLPHENVKHVLNAAAQTQDTIVSSSEIGTMPTEGFLSHNHYTDILASNLSSGTMHTNIGGLDNNSVHTLQRIKDMFDPIIQPNVIPQTQYFDTLDQTVRSPDTIYNSFLTTCVPIYLAKASLSSLSFSYDSASGNKMIHNAEPMVPMTNDELHRKVKSAFTMIETHVLRIIKQQRDDYEMVGNFACGGVSHSQIHFHCDMIKPDAYFEMPGIFGGINSMLVGDREVTEHNGIELARLVNTFDDTDQPLVHDTRTTHSPAMTATYDHGYEAYTQAHPPMRSDLMPQQPPTQDFLGGQDYLSDTTSTQPDDTLASSFSRRS